MNKDDLSFMKAVYRNWGYYGKTAHKQAKEIKNLYKLKGGLKE